MVCRSKEVVPQYHLGKYWHGHHMYCATCGGMVQSLDQFRFYYNYTYCMNCLCNVHNKPIENEVKWFTNTYMNFI